MQEITPSFSYEYSCGWTRKSQKRDASETERIASPSDWCNFVIEARFSETQCGSHHSLTDVMWLMRPSIQQIQQFFNFLLFHLTVHTANFVRVMKPVVPYSPSLVLYCCRAINRPVFFATLFMSSQGTCSWLQSHQCVDISSVFYRALHCPAPCVQRSDLGLRHCGSGDTRLPCMCYVYYVFLCWSRVWQPSLA